MSKKTPPSGSPPVSRVTETIPMATGIPFHINLIVAFVFFLFVMLLYKNIDSYVWVKDELIKENLKIIKKYPRLSTDEKLASKIGYDYQVLKILKDGTPANAIIHMPDAAYCATLRSQNKAPGLNGGGIHNRFWCSYYLYPRKLVYENEKTSPLHAKITHVAILGSQGYDKLPYAVAQKTDYTVLPIQP